MKFLAHLFLLMTTVYGNAQTIPDKAIDVSPLLIGEKSPDVLLKTIDGESQNLLGLLSKMPTVLNFYRGGWCPYCNAHLAELQDIEAEILTAGYQILAISPDSPENLKLSIAKHKLNYRLFSDADMIAARGFGIAFNVPEASRARLGSASDGNNPGQLPVPAVFVLNQQGEILFEHINPDYKKRLKASLLLCVLKELK